MQDTQNKWFDIWFDDRTSVLETMIRNMAADLKAGFNFHGPTIQRQIREIDEFKARFDSDMEHIKYLDDEKKVSRFCYYDLKKRGAIA